MVALHVVVVHKFCVGGKERGRRRAGAQIQIHASTSSFCRVDVTAVVHAYVRLEAFLLSLPSLGLLAPVIIQVAHSSMRKLARTKVSISLKLL